MKTIPDILPQLISDMEQRNLKKDIDNQVGVGHGGGMKKYKVVISKSWTVYVDAEFEDEAEEFAYEKTLEQRPDTFDIKSEEIE